MNTDVFSFVTELEQLNPPQAEIVKILYELYTTHPKVEDRFIYGGIGMYINDFLIGGIYPSKDHISLVFSRGNELTDKFKVLEGKGEFRRHIKVKTIEDIANKHCRFYIEQVVT